MYQSSGSQLLQSCYMNKVIKTSYDHLDILGIYRKASDYFSKGKPTKISGEISADNFALSDAEDKNSGPLEDK